MPQSESTPDSYANDPIFDDITKTSNVIWFLEKWLCEIILTKPSILSMVGSFKAPLRLNGESRANRERSRRCNPALSGAAGRRTFSAHAGHFFTWVKWEGCWKGRGARRPAWIHSLNICVGQIIRCTNKGQVNWVQPFRPPGFEGLFCFQNKQLRFPWYRQGHNTGRGISLAGVWMFDRCLPVMIKRPSRCFLSFKNTLMS